ncbi:YwqG family protein [Actinoplanes sp. NPDC051859]|uniref:YwqG family protein n=1 Tax=Actinoplanes sp. NPDC051859 TaxID=3363909 RepID=UPI00378BBDF9
MDQHAALVTLAHQHLPPAIADQWLGLVLPAGRLEPIGDDATTPVVGHLGGNPRLPDGVEWPHWPDHGPLTYIAGIDCAALPATELGLPFPADGTLLFFYFDGQLDDGDALVLPSEPDSAAGARVLYVPADVVTREHTTPDGIRPYPRVNLTVHLHATIGDTDHPRLVPAFDLAGRRDGHPLRGDDFTKAFYRWRDDSGQGHQIGGYPNAVQGPVEDEVADDSDATQWLLLAQIESDNRADMMWGDAGALYWLIRRDDLAAGRFDQARFTWQCC